MTTTPKTYLTPAEWRQLVLLNAEQLHGFLSSIPAQNESGLSALTDDAMALVDAHMARGRDLLVAWRKSRVPGLVAQQPAQEQPKANGHEPVKAKGKGGWPKGRKRGPRVQATHEARAIMAIPHPREELDWRRTKRQINKAAKVARIGVRRAAMAQQ